MLLPNIEYDLGADLLIAALDASTDLVEIDDLKGYIRYVNQTWCQYFGRERDDVIGMKWKNALVHSYNNDELGTSWDTCIAEGTANGEFVIRHSCGIEMTISYNRTLFRDTGGTQTMLITILRPSSEPVGFVRMYIEEQQLAASLSFHTPETSVISGSSSFNASVPDLRSVTGTITKRQSDVLRLVALGYSNREIALELMVGVSTVKTHVHNLLRRLGVTSRFEAIVWAREMNLV